MYPQDYILALFSLILFQFSYSVQSQAAPNPEVVYLLNCVNGGVYYSELGYYADWTNSRSGQFPDNVAIVQAAVPSEWDNTVAWSSGTQQSPVAGQFADGDTFQVWGLDDNVSPGTQTGQAMSSYHTFSCYRESDTQLFAVPGRESCNAAYSCTHEDFAGQESVLSTKSSLSSQIVNITNGADPATALQHFKDDLNNGVGCSGNSYDIGSSCSIQFTTCRFPGSDVADAISTYLTQVIAPSIPNTQHNYVPTQCSPYICAKFGGGADCSCNSNTVHDMIQSWPATGDVTVWTQLQGNTQSEAIQAEVTFQISCNSPSSSCNAQLCNTIAGGASAIGTLNPELAPIAIFGAFLTIGCLGCT